MKEKNERPDQKKTKKKKNKTAIDCRCLYLLTYKFNTIKNLGLFYLCIDYFRIPHNTLCLPPKFYITYCLKMLLGKCNTPRSI